MKNILSIAFLGTVLIFLASCQKVRQELQATVVEETQTAEINSSQTYSFNLPSSGGFYIEKDAQSGFISSINAEGTVYEYAPDPSFIGNETIVITNEKSKECGEGKRSCGDSEEELTYQRFTFNISVTESPK